MSYLRRGAYAWTYRDGDQNKTIAVLGIPPVDSPESAVRVAIASKGREVTSQQSHRNTEQASAPSTPRFTPGSDYWYGYLYAAFWAFVTYSCVTHALAMVIRLQTAIPNGIQARTEFLGSLILWPILTMVFGWVTYRLVTGKVSMKMIYVLVTVHALNVLAQGIIPLKLLLWIALSASVIVKFRKRDKLIRSN